MLTDSTMHCRMSPVSKGLNCVDGWLVAERNGQRFEWLECMPGACVAMISRPSVTEIKADSGITGKLGTFSRPCWPLQQLDLQPALYHYALPGKGVVDMLSHAV